MVPPGTLQTLRRLFRVMLPHRRTLVLTGALAVVSQALGLVVPWLTGQVVDDAVTNHDHRRLWLLVGVIVVVGTVKAIVMVARRLLAGNLSLDVEYDLRTSVYRHLLTLEQHYHDDHQTGQLLSRATADVTAIRVFLGYGLIFMTQYVALVAAVIALLIWTSPTLALASFVLAPLMVWMSARYSRRSFPVLRDVQQRVADVTTQAEEAIVGVRVIKAFAQEDREVDRFRSRSEAVFHRQVDATRLQSTYQPLLDLVPQLGVAIVLFAGGLAVANGSLTIGGFFQFNLYLGMLVMPLRMVGMWVGQVQRAVASGSRVFELLDTEPTLHSPAQPTPLPLGGGEVRLEGVRFGYDPERPILHEIDLELREGRTLALIGRTGSGKSTLAALIPRLYDVQAGRVLVDGVDVRELDLGELRRSVATVSQDTFLFSASVRDNIAFARPEASDAEVEQAARRAQAHDFVRALPKGYDTVIGERGLTLSGGQRQRIAIARALVADPRILILDDATASVDATTEARIRIALREAMAGRTTLIIAHRLSTLALADEIAVLDHGRVVSRGTHDEIVGNSPVYDEIWNHDAIVPTFIDLDGDRVAEQAT
ncbi:MAG: ATP-binding cassette, subfamily bacterial [Gaiellales bacterium]|nr:ATP-binding cassette, subfamily bacterial [Gaiellales bacterium]